MAEMNNSDLFTLLMEEAAVDVEFDTGNLNVNVADVYTKCGLCKMMDEQCHRTNGGDSFMYVMTNDQRIKTPDGKVTQAYKIGISKNPYERLKVLNSHPGVPRPFAFILLISVTCGWLAEKTIHTYFNEWRFNPKREFFNPPLEEIQHVCDTWFNKKTQTIDSRETSSKVTHNKIPNNKMVKTDMVNRCEYCVFCDEPCNNACGGEGYLCVLSNDFYVTNENGEYVVLYLITTSDDCDKTAKKYSSNTGVSLPYRFIFAKKVKCMLSFKLMMHKHLNKYHDTPEKEFFAAPIEEIKRAFVWISGPLLEDIDLCKKCVTPTDIVHIENQASSEEIAIVESKECLCPIDDAVVSNDSLNANANANANANVQPINNGVVLKCAMKGNPAETCYFNRVTRELFKDKELTIPLVDDNGDIILSVSTLVRRYCTKYQLVRNKNVQLSYKACKYLVEDTGKWRNCDASFTKKK